MLAGFQLGAEHVNGAGGVSGRPLELMVRDTAANPERAAAAVRELSALGAAAVVGEYHSVAAQAAAAEAEALKTPFLCASAVLDDLVRGKAEMVARLCPPQSRGWRVYAEYLLEQGYRHVAVAAQESLYWASGVRILRERLVPHGGAVIELDLGAGGDSLCEQILTSGASAVLLLVGYPEPAVTLVKTIREDARLGHVLVGAPAGQPEFASWLAALGRRGAEVPFLRYRAERLSPRGQAVEAELHRRLEEEPSFVALEGYDAILATADLLRATDDRGAVTASWESVAVEGSRGLIRFSRTSNGVWQWADAPLQIVHRQPGEPQRLSVLNTA